MNLTIIGSSFSEIAAALKLKAKSHKVFFIGLALLTFTHILLEYLLEKNGK